MINGSSLTCHHLPAPECVCVCKLESRASMCVYYLYTYRELCACVCVCGSVSVSLTDPRDPPLSQLAPTPVSRRQLNLRPRGQSCGRKQTHLRQWELCGGMTYVPTCQTGLPGFDSPGCAAAPPVRYVPAHLSSSCLQQSVGFSSFLQAAPMKSKSMS